MDAESGANHFAENRSHIRELYDTFGQVLSYVNMQRKSGLSILDSSD